MPSPARAAVLARLRDTIEGLEKRAPLAGPRQALAEAPFSHLPEDGLHEIWMPGFRAAAMGLAFALGHAAARLSPARPAVLWIQLEQETQQTGAPYAPGLAAFGLGPNDLVLIRTRTVGELLWASEEAAACRAVAGVIADSLKTRKALDFTASRRLALRAAESRVPIFALRYGTGREASAARTRWSLGPAPSARHPYDAQAPGAPHWLATLEKAPPGQAPGAGPWQLAWTGTHFVPAPPDPAPSSSSSSSSSPFGSTHGTPGSPSVQLAPARPAASGAPLPALGHRLPEAG